MSEEKKPKAPKAEKAESIETPAAQARWQQ